MQHSLGPPMTLRQSLADGAGASGGKIPIAHERRPGPRHHEIADWFDILPRVPPRRIESSEASPPGNGAPFGPSSATAAPRCRRFCGRAISVRGRISSLCAVIRRLSATLRPPNASAGAPMWSAHRALGPVAHGERAQTTQTRCLSLGFLRWFNRRRGSSGRISPKKRAAADVC